MKPTFEPTDDGLEIIDRIERHRYRLTTRDPVSIESVDCDEIQYPVDAAVRITTDALTLPTTHYVYVRDKTGSMIAEAKPDEQIFLADGEYTLDLSVPMKVYARVDSSVRVYSDAERTHIELNDSSSVILGARSYHTRPAHTVTTTAKPTDLMRAVSTFGSVLKTTTAERSYPTLRGHPPVIELGDELRVPDELSSPKTGIRIGVPRELDKIFVAAPLAYYLGATVVPDTQPRLVTDHGYTRSLTGSEGFETTVERTLNQLFFLDTVVRTEGMTPLPLEKRTEVEPLLDHSVQSLYEQPLAERVQNYLNVPYSELKPTIPEWQFEAHLDSTPDMAEFLPFIASDLAAVEVRKRRKEPPTVSKEAQTIADFTRGDPIENTGPVPTTEPESVRNNASKSPVVRQLWNRSKGKDIASTTPLSAFQNSIGRTPHDDPIDIDVVCNDIEMSEESEFVNDTYGERDKLPFDVTVHRRISTTELKDILATKSDFLHYIGHIDNKGFKCSDGKLNGKKIKESNVKAFFLNACQSHTQGLYLIEAGSIGGIVTLGNVINSGAIEVGRGVAKLLNQGFPLYGALDIVKNETVVGQQYYMVGDGRTTIAQSDLEVPNLCSIKKSNGGYLIDITTYDSVQAEKGTISIPHLSPIDGYYVVPGKTGQILAERSQLEEFLDQGRFPIVVDETVYWSDGVTVDSLW
ncbi:hypothetical protein [Natronococcus jeotgali]|uniref:Uncharacterized protein n=1 Tax=Natronococcus jeotgali DSM 18795 TaxID=1227498 RepID=L9XQS1_9EURY|nr:hypothetical protein [Natronococcus jeotgali]ELY64149.1 hypothetical protein C492_06497 [Natronococcus jeotgali DSM 18795]